MQKPKLNKYEQAILQVLAQAHRPMSIREIAGATHMSWATARKYLAQLVEKKLLV